MSYQEKNIAVSLIGHLTVFGLYVFYMFSMYQEGHLAGPEAGSLIGKSVFVLIGAAIVVSIVVQIVFRIIHAMVTKEYERSVTDERDKLIDLKSMQVAFIAFSLSFMASMGVLALEVLPSHLVFFLIVSAMFTACILGDATKLLLYRTGS